MKKTKMPQVSNEVLQYIDAAIDKAVEKAFYAGKEFFQEEIKNYYQHLENRLKAYSQLILNVEEYEKDIEDLIIEGNAPKKSKDIVMMPGSGIRLTDDEIFLAKILTLKRKKKIDQDEIDEINAALKIIKDEEYYMIIEHTYFDKFTDEKIAELIPCDKTTVWRNRGKLLRQMMIKLYGANALKLYNKSNYKKIAKDTKK